MGEKICPICGKFLEEIEALNKYGLKIRIDRCPSGCGLWFDRFELYQISFEESEKIVSDLTLKNSEKKDKILCPVCRIPIVKMKLSYFSEEILLDYCKGCSGVWMDKEKFLKYKRLQEEKSKKAFMDILKNNERNEGKVDSFLDFISKLFKLS